jgi:N-acetylglucosamine kinase-like BadF-type ATPase
MAQVFIGVDGGGSKTGAVVVDEQGREIGRGIAGASNYQSIGLEAALANVKTAIQAALTAAQFSGLPDFALIGVAGIDRPQDQSRWQQALDQGAPLARQVELIGDFELILYTLPEQTGLGLICGTGSIAFGRDGRGKRTRSGGWGYFFGDEGSGLWFGREALQAAVKASDGRGPKTSLLDLILQEWQLADPSSFIGEVYVSSPDRSGVDNTKIARLAPLVFQAAEAGDDVAKLLIRNAINELALALKACDKNLFFDRPPGLAVVGGLILHSPGFLDGLIKRLQAMMTIGEVVRVEDPALSAAQAAWRRGTGNV